MRIPSGGRPKKKLRSWSKFFGFDLWALDEVHFQQYGSRCRMWIPPEDRDPIVLHHPTRRSVGYFGAVRLRDGKFVFRREEHSFNAETFFSFMKYLRRVSSASGDRVIVITDNVRYHKAALHQEWRDAQSDDFDLEFLPPYSPDLNPIERLWKLVRRLATHNRYFPTLSAITDAVEATFVKWHSGSEAIRKLCAIT